METLNITILYFFYEFLDIVLVQVEYLHVFALILLTVFESRAILLHEFVLDIVECLVQHDILKSAHYFVEIDVFGGS